MSAGGFRITLIVGGSIAAYKSCELIRALVSQGAKVRVVMTRAAQEFVTPLTLQALSGRSVTTDLFDESQEAQIGHISLADEADVVVVAPATANIIAKAAQGIADDVASAILLATRAPVIFAPAMNCNMWENSITQENVGRLQERGIFFAEPEDGELACGWLGKGRLADTQKLVDQILRAATPDKLAGSRVIIAAGPTREALDNIRFLSNRSSGIMGYALARSAMIRGAEVSLISGPTKLKPASGIEVLHVQSALQMQSKLLEVASRKAEGEGTGPLYIFMVAAVADYRPKELVEGKIKSNKKAPLSLELIPNPDILQGIGQSREQIEKSSGRRLKLIGFTAETGLEVDELLAAAREKLAKKEADMIVGNFIEDSFERDTNRVWLIDKHGKQEELATAEKTLIAEKILNAAQKL